MKFAERAKSMDSICKSIEGHELFPRCVHTAIKTGWFADGRILFQVTADELIYLKAKKVDKCDVLKIEELIPKQVGPSLRMGQTFSKEKKEEFPEERPTLIEFIQLSNPDNKVYLEAWRVATIMERHENANAYLFSFESKYRDYPVLFSQKGKIVGTIQPYKITSRHPPITK